MDSKVQLFVIAYTKTNLLLKKRFNTLPVEPLSLYLHLIFVCFHTKILSVFSILNHVVLSNFLNIDQKSQKFFVNLGYLMHLTLLRYVSFVQETLLHIPQFV